MEQAKQSVTIRDEMWSMPDGVRLFTRVVLPGDGTGTYPTVLKRSPYEKETQITDETYRRYESDPLLAHGYAVVLQHCRGRYGSEGECIPYDDKERTDGLETLSRIRQMPHYNGEIYFSGTSYTASVLLMMLNDDLPDLKGACFTVQTESMYHRNFFNGLCRSYSGFTWWLSMISQQHPKIAPDEEIFVRPYRDIMKRAVGLDIPAFTDTLMNDRYNDFWKNDPRTGCMENLRIPVLLVGGWYDYYCYGMCSMWDKLPAETRARSAFLMGPWGHAASVPENSPYPFPHGDVPRERVAAWFDHLRLGTPYPYGEVGKFNYYVIGEDVWRAAGSPYEIAPCEELFFTAAGKLQTKKAAPAALTYRYDPDDRPRHDPHDAICACPEAGKYPDTVSFFSDPFEKDASFFGPVAFRGTLSSDCDDTAFCIRVYLVENGVSYNLVDLATTLRHAEPDYRAGGLCRVEILSQPTAFTVKRGCALRVDISSYSDCFVPHANTAKHFALETTPRVAHNTIHLGDAALILPLYE